MKNVHFSFHSYSIAIPELAPTFMVEQNPSNSRRMTQRASTTLIHRFPFPSIALALPVAGVPFAF
jgi:hypothetical protein